MRISTARVFFTALFIWLAASGALLIFRSTFTSQTTTEVLDLRSGSKGSCGDELSGHSKSANPREDKAPSLEDRSYRDHHSIESWSGEMVADRQLTHPQHKSIEQKALTLLYRSMMAEPAGTDLNFEDMHSTHSGSETTATGQQATDHPQQESADKAPHPVHLSYHNTMVKLGTDLKLDRNHQCPTGSYMLSAGRDFSPKHSNCPSLYIVGARKGGTSSLYQYVSKHPDFQGIKLDSGVQAGEAFYFQKSKLGSWKRYISLFPTTGNMTGESSVSYLVGSLVPKRLYEMCGKQAKVVMLLRDPVKRLESNFLMRVRYQTKSRNRSISPLVKHELGGYFKAVKRMKATHQPQEWSKLVGLYPPARNMVFEGLYYVHLLNWLCNFPAENILIINSEEFYQNSSTILDLVFQFLGLKRLDAETYAWITSATYNKGSYSVPAYQKLSDAHIEKLLGVYRPFNKALLELLQWENHQWLANGVN